MLVYLTPENYSVNQSEELCNNLRGYSFVFFTSARCSYCKDVYPAFVRLSETIQGCVFGVMNVEQNNNAVVQISKRSKTPLEYVPYIILYANGRPLSQYVHDENNPQANLERMKTFLVQQTTRKQTADGATSAVAAAVIPPYSIGIPKNRASSAKLKKVCYLSYDTAYEKKR